MKGPDKPEFEEAETMRKQNLRGRKREREEKRINLTRSFMRPGRNRSQF